MHYVAMMMMAIYGDMQIWRYMVKWLPYHNPLIHPPPPPPTRVHKHKTQSLPTHTPPSTRPQNNNYQALPQNAHVQASTTNKPHATKFCKHPYAYQYQRGHLISNCLRTRAHKLTTKPFPKTPTYTHPPLKSHTPQLLPILPLSTTPFHHPPPPPPPPHTTSTTHIPYDTTRSQPCTIYDHIS